MAPLAVQPAQTGQAADVFFQLALATRTKRAAEPYGWTVRPGLAFGDL